MHKKIIISFVSLFTIYNSNVLAKDNKFIKASYYSHRFHKKLTASGETYNMYNLTAASNKLKFGTIVRITNMENGKSVKVRINDRGKLPKNRDIDLSFAAAKKLGILRDGIKTVKMEILS